MDKMYYLIESEFNPDYDTNITTEVIMRSKKVSELKSYLRGIYEEALEQSTYLINGVDMVCNDELPPKFKRRLSVCYESDCGAGKYVDYVIISATDLNSVEEI